MGMCLCVPGMSQFICDEPCAPVFVCAYIRVRSCMWHTRSLTCPMLVVQRHRSSVLIPIAVQTSVYDCLVQGIKTFTLEGAFLLKFSTSYQLNLAMRCACACMFISVPLSFLNTQVIFMKTRWSPKISWLF